MSTTCSTRPGKRRWKKTCWRSRLALSTLPIAGMARHLLGPFPHVLVIGNPYVVNRYPLRHGPTAWEPMDTPHGFGYLSLIHISEPTRLGMISYAVFCLKKKKKK